MAASARATSTFHAFRRKPADRGRRGAAADQRGQPVAGHLVALAELGVALARLVGEALEELVEVARRAGDAVLIATRATSSRHGGRGGAPND